MPEESQLPPAINWPEYVLSLERRVTQLEAELKQSQEESERLDRRLSTLQGELPNTHLLSHSFLWRAFTVWGHYLVAQLLIAIPLWCLLTLLTGGRY